jgi:competence protein ComEA
MEAMHKLWEIYKIPLLLGSASIIFVIVSLVLLVKSVQTSTPIQFSTTETLGDSGGLRASIAVDVGGAVRQPGVYMLSMGARVEEALEAAGGIHQNADMSWVEKNINRAAKITDGVKIYIPSKTETSHNEDCESPNADVAQSCGIVTISTGASQNITPVSINMASQSELETLTGVGPVTAQKIIDNRPYTDMNQLVSKKAIGQSLFEKIRSHISL